MPAGAGWPAVLEATLDRLACRLKRCWCGWGRPLARRLRSGLEVRDAFRPCIPKRPGFVDGERPGKLMADIYELARIAWRLVVSRLFMAVVSARSAISASFLSPYPAGWAVCLLVWLRLRS
jgi:hypothetical protein